MLNGYLVDSLIIAYLIYSAFIGLKRGFFNVLVGIFGTYGACFLAWIFQDEAYGFLTTYLSIGADNYSAVFFLLLWFAFYAVTYLLAKLLTGVFKLSGINFILRIVGGALNFSKAVLIVVVVLTFMSGLKVAFYEKTVLTNRFILIGSKVLTVFKQSVDENRIELNELPATKNDKSIMDDDFRYNLLER